MSPHQGRGGGRGRQGGGGERDGGKEADLVGQGKEIKRSRGDILIENRERNMNYTTQNFTWTICWIESVKKINCMVHSVTVMF